LTPCDPAGSLAPLSVLRGVINPAIDGRLAQDRVLHATLGKLDGRSGR
jgi:hypothetical protein